MVNNVYIKSIIAVLFVGLTGSVSWCWGITPDEVVVVVNTRMAGAVKIADYYMAKRNIPADRLVKTSLTFGEVMGRDEYNEALAGPVGEKIKQLAPDRITAIVLIFGIPLKVLPPDLSWDDLEQLRIAEKQKSLLELQGNSDAGQEDKAKKHALEKKIEKLAGRSKRAAVDSELALVLVGGYPLDGWIENPYFIGFQGRSTRLKKKEVLLVSRLDGPDVKTVYRIIDDTLQAERDGLQGRAYFDARWPRPEKSKQSGYALYDHSLHRAAEVVSNRMETVVDAREDLFPVGGCPEAALYAGWYSLGKYRDSFQWVKGAVGYHIASAECTTLKNASSKVWCLQMLKHGVAATIGPVYEPYVQGFPYPELFFAALTEGYMDLGESYLISLPYLSWQMVLIGDPLYKPFKPLENKK